MEAIKTVGSAISSLQSQMAHAMHLKNEIGSFSTPVFTLLSPRISSGKLSSGVAKIWLFRPHSACFSIEPKLCASFFVFAHDIKATLKCVVVGKEYNYKYLVVLYTYHFRYNLPRNHSCLITLRLSVTRQNGCEADYFRQDVDSLFLFTFHLQVCLS